MGGTHIVGDSTLYLLCEDWACHGDECGIDWGLSVGSFDGLASQSVGGRIMEGRMVMGENSRNRGLEE